MNAEEIVSRLKKEQHEAWKNLQAERLRISPRETELKSP